MNKSLLFPVLTFLILLLPIQSASAFYQNGMLLNSVLMHFDFSEYDEEREVLNESGFLYGAELEFGTKIGTKPFWFSTTGQVLRGVVNYDGETQNGVPHQTTTNELIYDWNMQIGRIYESWRRHDYATIYAGVGFHQWIRDINSKFNPLAGVDQTGENVIGLFERYTWYYANVGARGFIFRTQRAHMLIELNLLRTLSPIMEVSFRGQKDPAKVSLGEHYGAKLSLPIRYEITRRFQIYSEFFFEAWDLGRSKRQNITENGIVYSKGGLFEPRSTSRFKGVVLGVFLRFE